MKKCEEKIVCAICGIKTNYYDTSNFYIHHVKKYHDLTSREYFERYLRKDGDGFCLECGKETKYSGGMSGYREYCSHKCQAKNSVLNQKKMDKIREAFFKEELKDVPEGAVFCKLCNRQTKYTIDTFSRYHLKPIHDIDMIEYYNLTEKKEGEGVCPVCGKITKIRRYSDGYRKYCSNDCALKEHNSQWDKWDVVRKERNLEKYGVVHPMILTETQNKRKESCLRNNGVEFPVQNKEIKKQIFETFRSRYQEVVSEKLPEGYALVEYNTHTDLKICCPKGHMFEPNSMLFVTNRLKQGSEICPECNPLKGYSSGEKEMYEFCKQFVPDLSANVRGVIGVYEMDCYSSSLKIGIEYNGMYWHSSKHKDNKYHQRKTIVAEMHGVKLIQIWESDWVLKNNIVCSMLKTLFGKNSKISVKDCVIESVPEDVSKLFLESNNLYGVVETDFCYGLKYNNELISIMGVKGNEIVVLCDKIDTCNDGLEDMFMKFLEDKKPEKVGVKLDRFWNNGYNEFRNIGFEFVGYTEPSNYHIYWDEDYVNFLKSECGEGILYDSGMIEYCFLI